MQHYIQHYRRHPSASQGPLQLNIQGLYSVMYCGQQISINMKLIY